MASEENRAAFIADPSAYVPVDGPAEVPPPRFCFIGPSHSGKTVNGRRIARRHRLFHISFAERLNEIAADPEATFHAAAKSLLGEDKVDLDPETLLGIVKPFWTEEPYSSSGFVLEGFPRTEDDARLLVEAGLVPDAVVSFSMEAEHATKRILPKLMEKFTEERNRELAKRGKKVAEHKKKLEDHKKEWEDGVEKAKAEKEAERERRFLAGEEDEDEDEDDEDEAEYEEPEWAELEEEEELEPLDEASERMEGEISEAHEAAVDDASGVMDFMTGEEVRVKPVNVDSIRREASVRRVVDTGLAPFLERRSNVLAYVRVLSYAAATELLNRGLVRMSSFGWWCPVSLTTKSCGLPILGGRYPAIYRGAVYFMASHTLRKKFVDEPLKYGPQATKGAPPVAPASVVLLGGPSTDRAALAERICQDLDLVRINPEATVEGLLAEGANSRLASKVRQLLEQGSAMPDELLVEALQRTLLSYKAQTHGYVLDGFPQTLEHVKLLEQAGIRPRSVFHLIDGAGAKLDLDAFAALRQATFDENTPAILKWYGEEFDCVTELEGTRSLWWLATHVTKCITDQLACEHAYTSARLQGAPAPASRVGFSRSDVKAALSHQGYCPVRLHDHGELMEGDTSDARHCVLYNGLFFKLGDAEAVSLFSRDPQKYVQARLPDDLPILRTAQDVRWAFPQPVMWGGFCPVTYNDNGRRYAALKQGSNDFAVEYKGGFYIFVNDAARGKFMRKPDSFASIPLPDRLPPKLSPVDSAQLPHLGYMEQTVSLLVTKACAACGITKPKYPFMSVEQSAAVYVALYLRAHNPKSSAYARSEARKRLRTFEQRCQLVRYLGSNIQVGSDHATERPFDFKYKVEEFLALQGSS
mmetsp:Transcript_29271/g.87728  ORF Transcript_29271/g.87728 Transcript_29271/m.87728 type:complete len:870 (+) Transcript_29271:79-2688(+)